MILFIIKLHIGVNMFRLKKVVKSNKRKLSGLTFSDRSYSVSIIQNCLSISSRNIKRINILPIQICDNKFESLVRYN